MISAELGCYTKLFGDYIILTCLWHEKCDGINIGILLAQA